MTKIIKIITASIISLVLLLSMTNAGVAETTISAEGQYIFNTLAILYWCSFSSINGSRFLYARMWISYNKKCFNNCS